MTEDYGKSSNARVYEQLERVIERGLDRIDGSINGQTKRIDQLTERVTRLEERVHGISDVKDEVANLSSRIDILEKAEAKRLGIATGISLVIGATGGWLANILTDRTPP